MTHSVGQLRKALRSQCRVQCERSVPYFNLFILGFLMVCLNGNAEPVFSAKFSKRTWNDKDWILAKEPDLNHCGNWVQRDDYIENELPPDKPNATGLEETFTSMVYKEKISGNFSATTTLEFLVNQSPGMILCGEIGNSDDNKPEYRESIEIYAWHKGVNIWRHVLKDGKWTYTLAAYGSFTLKPNTRYKLDVQRKGNELSVAIDGHNFGYLEASLPGAVYVGPVGCEGVNRFYDFAIERPAGK